MFEELIKCTWPTLIENYNIIFNYIALGAKLGIATITIDIIIY